MFSHLYETVGHNESGFQLKKVKARIIERWLQIIFKEHKDFPDFQIFMAFNDKPN